MKKCGAACFCQTTSCSVGCFWVRYKKSLSKFHFLGQFFFFKYFRWWYSKTSILMLFCMYSFAIFSFKVPLVTVWRRHIMQYVCDLMNRVKFWMFAKMNLMFSPFNLLLGLTKFAEYKTRCYIQESLAGGFLVLEHLRGCLLWMCFWALAMTLNELII